MLFQSETLPCFGKKLKVSGLCQKVQILTSIKNLSDLYWSGNRPDPFRAIEHRAVFAAFAGVSLKTKGDQLDTFDALPSGEAFILVNDHDPKPLYYQFLHEREGLLGWEYLEEGPEQCRVKISKT